MQGFQLPHCQLHKGKLVSHICLDTKASLVCQTCLASNDCCALHLKNVMDIPSFISNVEDTTTNLEREETRAMDNFSELGHYGSPVQN